MVTNVISWLISAIVELNAIAKICKYTWLYSDGHGGAQHTRHDMDRFIKECAYLFPNRWLRGHLFGSFCVQFFNQQRVSIAFKYVLAFVIKKKIALVWDVYSRPPITIKSHDLDANDIRKVVDEIASYHEKD
jgi:hypothetical protein